MGNYLIEGVMMKIPFFLFITLLFGSLFFFAGCDLFENDKEPSEPQNFGFEEGYFIYDLELNKIPWIRDRNFLSLKFSENVSDSEVDEIFESYGFLGKDEVYSLNHFFVRSTTRPAEYYYTNEPEGGNSGELGALEEVVFSLPVFINEVGQHLLLTDIIRIEFKGISKEEEYEIIDSLSTVDNLVLARDTEEKGQTYHLRTLKSATENSLRLSNRYSLIQKVKFAIPDYAFQIN